MPGDKKNNFSYKKAGVDIDKATETLKSATESITSTFNKNVLNDLSSFGGLFKLDLNKFSCPVLVSSTDGVGTKILLAKESGKYGGLGQDLVAMCINDIICCGAKPLFFLDYIACGKIKQEIIKEIIASIAGSCKICRTALIGGETAEMPGMYGRDDIDLAGFVVGIADKDKLINKGLVREGDVLIGVPSSGIHSNGFSLVREVIRKHNLDLSKKFNSLKEKKLIDVLMVPTKLYYSFIEHLTSFGKLKIHGIAHITGGGFYDNIARILPGELDAEIKVGSWDIHPVFNFLKEEGNIGIKEMYRVFNMGIGMVLIISPEDVELVGEAAENFGEKVFQIGKIIKGNGKVRIKFNG